MSKPQDHMRPSQRFCTVQFRFALSCK